jgi:hypothetical protein
MNSRIPNNNPDTPIHWLAQVYMKYITNLSHSTIRHEPINEDTLLTAAQINKKSPVQLFVVD